jgi:outer membrane protein assembly factor BamB
MKRKRSLYITILLTITIALLMSSCSGRSTMTASGWAGIAVDEDTAYVAFNSFVIAINLDSGTERWRYPSEADTNLSFYAPPAITQDGRLIVGGYDSILYSIDTNTGQGTPFFEGAEGRFIGGPIITSAGIFAPSADHWLYALNLNGELLWKFETAEPLWSKAATSSDCDCVYISSMDHKVYALEAQTGRVKWVTDDLGGAIVGTPLVSEGGFIFTGTFNNELVALDAETGKVSWHFQTNDWVWAAPAIEEGTLYFGDLSGTLYAINSQNGVSQWQIQPGGPIVGTPLVTDEGVFFTTEDGNLISVNSSGTTQWTKTYETNLHAGPVEAGDTILVATSDPEKLLVAFDPNGVQKWSFALDQ